MHRMVCALRRVGAAALGVTVMFATASGLAGCAGSAAPPQLTQPVVLLGEVHDNAAQHALRRRLSRRAT